MLDHKTDLCVLCWVISISSLYWTAKVQRVQTAPQTSSQMPDYLWMLPDLGELGDEDEGIFEQSTGKEAKSSRKQQFSVKVESQ